MARTLVVLAAIAAAVAAAASAAPSAGPVLAISYVQGAGWSRLGVVDPLTLEPQGPTIRIGTTSSSWTYSPDRLQLAIAAPGQGLRIVDRTPLRLRTTIRLPRPSGQIFAVSWLRRDRLLALVLTPQGVSVVAADPETGRIVHTTALRRSYAFAFGRLADGIAFLLDSSGRFAPAEVAVADLDARVRVATVRRAVVGTVIDRRAREPVAHRRGVGFAVDPAGRRTYVVARDFSVATVDLGTLAVTYHSLTARTTAAAHRTEKWIVGWDRTAAWLGDGLLVASGSSSRREGTRTVTTPLPLRLIDTRDWTSRTLDVTGWPQVAAGLLLAEGPDNVLRAFGADGAERYGLQLADSTWVNYGAGLAYLCRNLVLTRVVDVATGATLREPMPGAEASCRQVLADQASRI